MNLSIFYFINHTLANPLFDFLTKAVTLAGDYGWTLAVPWLGFMIFGAKSFRPVGWALLPLLFLSDFIPGKILKPLFAEARPFLILSDVRLVLPVDAESVGPYGFPSNHASNMFALAMFFSLVYPRKKIILSLFLFAAFIGFSRIYIGVHFPFDVVAGAIWGTLCGVIVFNCLDIFHNRRGSKKDVKPGAAA